MGAPVRTGRFVFQAYEFSGVKFLGGFQGGNRYGFRAKKRSLILACAFSRRLKKTKKKPPRARARGGLIPRFSFTLAAASGGFGVPLGAVSIEKRPKTSGYLIVVLACCNGTSRFHGFPCLDDWQCLARPIVSRCGVVVARCDGGFNRPVLCPVHNSWVSAVSRRKSSVKKSRRFPGGCALRAGLAHEPPGDDQWVHAPALSRQCCEFWGHKKSGGFPPGCD